MVSIRKINQDFVQLRNFIETYVHAIRHPPLTKHTVSSYTGTQQSHLIRLTTKRRVVEVVEKEAEKEARNQEKVQTRTQGKNQREKRTLHLGKKPAILETTLKRRQIHPLNLN